MGQLLTKRTRNSLSVLSTVSLIKLGKLPGQCSWFASNLAGFRSLVPEIRVNFSGLTYEPRHDKTNILHMRKQRRRSVSR